MNGQLDERAIALQAAVAGELSLEAELGRGGMGVVYLARDVALDRPVAIKLLHESLAHDAAARERFLSEARTCARLVHPNIVPIYDVGEHGPLAWFVMGYVDGEPLADRLERDGPLRSREIGTVLRDIGWALAAAHGTGVLHRDISLSNILIERTTGRALLVDFGLAVEFAGGDAGPLVGTPEYLAPELLHGAAPAPSSDLYALGVVGWALATGHLPITGDSPAAVLLKLLQETPAPLELAAPGIPRALRAAIGAALESDPDRRPAKVEEWLRLLDDEPLQPSPELPLVRWVDSGKSARPFHALAFSLAGMLTILSRSYWGFIALPLIGRVPTALAVIGLALSAGSLVHFGLATAAIRRAARAGYVLTDLRVALSDAIRRRVEGGGVPAPLVGRVVNDLTWLAGIAVMSVLLISALSSGQAFRVLSPSAYSILVIISDWFQWLWLTWFVGMGFRFILPARAEKPRSLRWRLRELFWNSPLGGVAFGFASFGLGKHRQIPNTLHRPTEVMLQVGINDLYGALPAPQRRGLAELPGVANRLQRKVGQVRERITLLEGVAGERSTEAAALRERLILLRDEAIAALERLRRDLLRLGSQVATTGPLTEQLQRIRATDQQLLQALRSLP